MHDPQDDLRYLDPPPGFVVLRESELDPEEGRSDRWIARGIINGRSVIRSDLRARSSACRSAWFAYDDARALTGEAPDVTDVAQVDSAIAEALARKHAIHREIDADRPTLKTEYRVRLDSWDHMRAALLAQIVADAGSIRRASKVVGIPRSTLSAWIRQHRADGSWPR
jgi:hypothetical protein